MRTLTLALVLLVGTTSAVAQDRLLPELLVGLWNGKMMNPQGSVRGIITTVIFRDEAGRITGSATFKNYDLNVEASGAIDQVLIRGDTLTFRVGYRGGAPGVDGTYGNYKFRFVSPDQLEGDGQRELNYVFWKMEKATPTK